MYLITQQQNKKVHEIYFLKNKRDFDIDDSGAGRNTCTSTAVFIEYICIR